jgi:hypothetical protein
MDMETIQTLLDLLNPLHGDLDRQIYDDRMREELDIPRDREWNVNVTEGMERDLTQAVLILEDRMRQAKAKIRPCDCAAETTGKWADKHSPGCAALRTD